MFKLTDLYHSVEAFLAFQADSPCYIHKTEQMLTVLRKALFYFSGCFEVHSFITTSYVGHTHNFIKVGREDGKPLWGLKD